MEPLEQDNHKENKIKQMFKKVWSFMIYVCMMSILIGVVVVSASIVMFESQENTEKEEKKKFDLHKRFVTFKDGKDGKKSIILDVENHCLYIGENGVIESPLVKNGQFDCNVKYTEEYKSKKDSKK